MFQWETISGWTVCGLWSVFVNKTESRLIRIRHRRLGHYVLSWSGRIGCCRGVGSRSLGWIHTLLSGIGVLGLRVDGGRSLVHRNVRVLLYGHHRILRPHGHCRILRLHWHRRVLRPHGHRRVLRPHRNILRLSSTHGHRLSSLLRMRMLGMDLLLLQALA